MVWVMYGILNVQDDTHSWGGSTLHGTALCMFCLGGLVARRERLTLETVCALLCGNELFVKPFTLSLRVPELCSDQR